MTEEICGLTATELAERVRRRELSCVEVLEAHLRQIERVNPTVNAIVTLAAERALDEARAADARTAAGEETGPLHGLPIAHKDTHATAGIRTTYGSRLLAENVPTSDELIVERLRRAGAITIGKTNVPEFAAGSHTFNEIFGTTLNPYDLGRSAGGSSGGAAAALACRMQPLAEGSDMGGSLRNPASFCNVVGLRPSLGLVPTHPAPLPWSTLAVQGPMARTVADVGLMLSVLAGADPRAPLGAAAGPFDFLSPGTTDLRGLRVAWSVDLGGQVPVDPAVVEVVERQVPLFEELGCTVEEACPDLRGADDAFRVLRAWQFDLQLGDTHRRHPGALRATLAQNVDAGEALSGRDVARAAQVQGEIFHRTRRFFEEYDVLLLPVSQVPPFPAAEEYPTVVAGHRQRDYLDWMRSAYLVSVTGSPALSVPAGFTPDGLPVGLQVVGPHRGDASVLRVGRAFETATRYGDVQPPLLTGGP
jgi:amidase